MENESIVNCNINILYHWFIFRPKEIIILRKLAAGHLGSGRPTKVLSLGGEETFSYLSQSKHYPNHILSQVVL